MEKRATNTLFQMPQFQKFSMILSGCGPNLKIDIRIRCETEKNVQNPVPMLR